MNTTTIQFRVDSKTKNEAKKILKKVGIDLSGALKIFLKQVINKKTLPLEFRDENGFTPKKKRELLDDIAWAKKYGKQFNSVEELLADLNS